MIEQVNRILKAINTGGPKFEAQVQCACGEAYTPPENMASHSSTIVLTCSLGGSPLYLEAGMRYELHNESDGILAIQSELEKIVIEACVIFYHDWLNAAVDRWGSNTDAHENRGDLPANDMKPL